MSTIRLEKVAKIYKSRDFRQAALLNVDLKAEQGDFIFLVGSRGAGKSTLLAVASGLVRPDRGTVWLDDVDIFRLGRRERARVPEFIGYVPETFPSRRAQTVRNVMLASSRLEELKGRLVTDTRMEPQLEKALSLVGMSGSEERLIGQLSPPEQRRVQVAKAIMHSPDVLLLDEVTNKMDDDTVWDLMHLFAVLNERGTTVIMATCASRIVNAMRRRVVTLADGKVVGDVQRGKFGEIPGRPFGITINGNGGRMR